MTLPQSRGSYRDEYELMERALLEPKGVRACIGSQGDAVYKRMRLNKARLLDRNLNTQAYSPGDPLYGASTFDELIFSVKEDTNGNWWVYLEKSRPPLAVEPIEAAE